MTISSTNRKAGPFNGNGVTTVFPFTFKVFAGSDLRVIKTSTLGVDSDLVLTTNYTVALNPDQDSSPGGSVTALVAPATGEKLTIVGNMPALQPVELISGGGWYPEVIEAALDRCVIICQQVLGLLTRSIRFPSSDSSALIAELPTAAVRANKALVFGADGSVGISTSDYEDQAGDAAASAAAAAASAATSTTQAGISTTGATTATAQAVIATTQAGISTTQAAAALASANAAATSYDNFDDRFLGAKSSDPIVDNDGNPLLVGALYFNSVSNAMRVYSVSLAAWQPAASTVVRNGAGAPGAGLGADGDFYINNSNYDLYGPKAAGAWPAPVSMIGPNGPGSGDVLGPGASITDEIALFNGATGQLLKRATGTGIGKITAGKLSIAAAGAGGDYVAPGAVTANGVTMSTAKLLGRSTAATGAVEEITVGGNLTLAAGSLSASDGGLSLLAVLTPTVAANLDFLNVFSSTYDDYLIIIDSLTPSAADTINVRFAVAGVVQTGASDYRSSTGSTIPSSGSAITAVTTSTSNTGSGVSGNCTLNNVNDTGRFKHQIWRMVNNDGSNWRNDAAGSAYNQNSALSGFRLYWNGGANFQAVGNVRVYGYKKA